MHNKTERKKASPAVVPTRARGRRRRLGMVLGLTMLLLLLGYGLLQGSKAVRAGRQRRAAEQALEARDFQAASEPLSDYLTLRPHDTEVRLLAAQTARRGGDFEAALREQRRYLAEGGADPPVQREQRLLHLQQGDLTTAPALLAEYPEDPLVLEAYLIGGLRRLAPPAQSGLSFRDGPAPAETPRLLHAAQRWLELRLSRADQVQGFLWRGRVQALAGNRTQTIADYRQALALDPDHYEARKFLVYAMGDDDPREAVTHFEILHQRRSGDNNVTFSLASLYYALGRLPEARQLLDSLLANNPQETAFVLTRGLVALDEGEVATAERLLRQALAQAPNHPPIHLGLSRCLRSNGKLDEAKAHYNRYRQLQDTPNTSRQ